MNETKLFPTVIEIIDNSNIYNLGWTDVDKVILEEPIWRIPVYSVSVLFSSRVDCKRFAENIAFIIAGGKRSANNNKNSDSNSSSENSGNVNDTNKDIEEDINN